MEVALGSVVGGGESTESRSIQYYGRHLLVAGAPPAGHLTLTFPKGFKLYTLYATNEPPSGCATSSPTRMQNPPIWV